MSGRPPLPPPLRNKPAPPYDLPREVRVNANNSNSNNNLGSVASSVSFGHRSEGNVTNNEWENENGNNNWNENENANNQWENDGTTVFWIGAESDVLRGTAAKENFNKITAEIIAAHPEWRLHSVSGNPQAYGEHQAGYHIGVVTQPATDPPALFAIWPQFLDALEERLPGADLPRDLKAATGWLAPEEVPGYAFAQMMAPGQGGRRRAGKRKVRKTRRAQRKRKTRRHSRR